MLEKVNFTWTETTGTVFFDGPTMLWILLSKTNPFVCVGLSFLKANLLTTTMTIYTRDVVNLLDYIHEQYTSIYDSY